MREPEKLRRAFSLSAPYLQGTLRTEYTGLDYFEYGPQMSRGFRALKVWMTLRHYGVEGYRRLLRQGIHCAQRLDERVRASDEIQRHGIAFIMTTRIRERIVLRMSICSHRTTLSDIDAVFDALTRIGREISAEEHAPG